MLGFPGAEIEGRPGIEGQVAGNERGRRRGLIFGGPVPRGPSQGLVFFGRGHFFDPLHGILVAGGVLSGLDELVLDRRGLLFLLAQVDVQGVHLVKLLGVHFGEVWDPLGDESGDTAVVEAGVAVSG